MSCASCGTDGTAPYALERTTDERTARVPGPLPPGFPFSNGATVQRCTRSIEGYEVSCDRTPPLEQRIRLQRCCANGHVMCRECHANVQVRSAQCPVCCGRLTDPILASTGHLDQDSREIRTGGTQTGGGHQRRPALSDLRRLRVDKIAQTQAQKVRERQAAERDAAARADADERAAEVETLRKRASAAQACARLGHMQTRRLVRAAEAFLSANPNEASGVMTMCTYVGNISSGRRRISTSNKHVRRLTALPGGRSMFAAAGFDDTGDGFLTSSWSPRTSAAAAGELRRAMD